MSTGLRVSALVAGACCLLALSIRLEAATQVEGIATYEVFSNGTRRLLVEEQFWALMEGDKWSINTRLVSTQPPLTRPELFCPQRQSAGSDGNDVYYLKEMTTGTGHAPIGWVEPGPVPNIAQSPTVCLLWMAYCSGYYLAKAERQELRPVWGIDAGRNRRGECLVRVSSHRSLDSPDYLDQLNFLSDGRVNPCNPSRGITNVWARPWAGGFTQGVFRVEEAIALSAGGKIPGTFKFEVLAPVAGVSPPRLDARSAMHGTVATVAAAAAKTGGVQVVSWLPLLPKDQKVIVRDYRFTGEVTNWESVDYAVTNQWSARNGAAAKAAANIHAAIDPPISLSKRPKAASNGLGAEAKKAYARTAAHDALEAACKTAASESKVVFIKAGFPECGWCRVFDRYHNLPDVQKVLGKFYVIVAIDTEYMPDGDATFSKYAKPGAPSWVIISPQKKVIVDSYSPAGNVGYPLEPNGTAYYIAALRKATPAITEAELQTLSQQIKKAAVK